MLSSKHIVRIFLTLCLSLFSIIGYSQDLYTYTGSFGIGTNIQGFIIKGEAEYTYLTKGNPAERVYHGQFNYQESKKRDRSTYSLSIEGSFEDGLKVDKWKYHLKSLEDDFDVNIDLDANYYKGRKNGEWIQRAYTSEKDIHLLRVNFIEGRPVGLFSLVYHSANFYYLFPELKVTGQFNNNGYPIGKWTFDYQDGSMTKYREVLNFNIEGTLIEGINIETGEIIKEQNLRATKILDEINKQVFGKNIKAKFNLSFISGVFSKGELASLKSNEQLEIENKLRVQEAAELEERNQRAAYAKKERAFDRIMIEAKNEESYDLKRAIKLYNDALAIFDSEEVRQRIDDLKKEETRIFQIDSLIERIDKLEHKDSYYTQLSLKYESAFVNNDFLSQRLGLLGSYFEKEINERHSDAKYNSGYKFKSGKNGLSNQELYNSYVDYSKLLDRRSFYLDKFSRLVKENNRKKLRDFKKLNIITEVMQFLENY